MKTPTATFSGLGVAAFLFCAACLHGQSFRLGEETKLIPSPKPEISIYPYCPDGHVTVFPDGKDLLMFWAGSDSFSSRGKTLFEMAETRKVLSRGDAEDFDNGGAWLYSVFSKVGGRMVGFYHCEDHRFVGDPTSTFIAYKSIARCESANGGRDWKKDAQILTAEKPKPEKPEWSGLGDHCTIWDATAKRYICYFQEEGILRMASSADPEGRPGTWKKWFQGEFSEPGLGGRATPIPNLNEVHGGNPSVHWNTFLKCWVMVYHTWPGSLVMSQSNDLISWSLPVVLVPNPSPTSKVWYATIIGQTDVLAGERATLVYGYFPDINKHEREFLAREITFVKSP